MLDGSLMLRVNLATVDTIHPQSNKIVTAVKFKASGDSKLNDYLGNQITPYWLMTWANNEGLTDHQHQ